MRPVTMFANDRLCNMNSEVPATVSLSAKPIRITRDRNDRRRIRPRHGMSEECRRPTVGRRPMTTNSSAARTGDLIGYARVSTWDQNLALQVDALHAAGCVRIYEETASGTRADRPRLAEAVDALRPGDSVVMWRLDRASRSLQHLVTFVADLRAKGCGFRALQEGILLQPGDHSASSNFQWQLWALLAEFERGLIVERTRAGLEAARLRGSRSGRKAKLSPDQKALATRLYFEDSMPVAQIATMLGTSRATVYRAVQIRATRRASTTTTASTG